MVFARLDLANRLGSNRDTRRYGRRRGWECAGGWRRRDDGGHAIQSTQEVLEEPVAGSTIIVGRDRVARENNGVVFTNAQIQSINKSGRLRAVEGQVGIIGVANIHHIKENYVVCRTSKRCLRAI